MRSKEKRGWTFNTLYADDIIILADSKESYIVLKIGHNILCTFKKLQVEVEVIYFSKRKINCTRYCFWYCGYITQNTINLAKNPSVLNKFECCKKCLRQQTRPTCDVLNHGDTSSYNSPVVSYQWCKNTYNKRNVWYELNLISLKHMS